MITDSSPATVNVLIRAGRSALQPTLIDRERVAGALRARLDAASNGLRPAASLAMSHGLAWPTLSALVVGLAVGGLVVASSFPNKEAPAPGVLLAAPAALPPPPSTVQVAAVPAALPAVEQPPTAEVARAQSRKPAADNLAEEVEILSRAQTELHLGGFAGALRILEEHARRFQRGTLAPERRAARIQALCGLGRTTEAAGELARLAPGSLHEGRAREACAAGPKSAAD
jgi:hypothetical protein